MKIDVKTKFLLAFSFILFLLGSCNKKENANSPERELLRMPRLIDSLKHTGEALEVKSKTITNYIPLYIGENKPVIHLNHDFYNHTYPDKYFIYPTSPFIGFRKKDLDIFIDTTTHTINEDYLWNTDQEELEGKTIRAYPVVIRNNLDTMSFVGFGEHIPMVLQAKDSLQEWRPIEEVFFYMCGTGLQYIQLPPQEIVITSVPIFKGNFKTELRLKCDSIFSNVISGWIHPNQFESE